MISFGVKGASGSAKLYQFISEVESVLSAEGTERLRAAKGTASRGSCTEGMKRVVVTETVTHRRLKQTGDNTTAMEAGAPDLPGRNKLEDIGGGATFEGGVTPHEEL